MIYPSFLDWYIKSPTFSDVSSTFYSENFRCCLFASYSMNCLQSCLTTSNKWVQKSKGSIWLGQHFRRFSIWMGPFFSNARYINGVGFEILARAPVPHLPQNYLPNPPPPPPPPPHEIHHINILSLNRYIWPLQTVSSQSRCQRMRYLISVCSNIRALAANKNQLRYM